MKICFIPIDNRPVCYNLAKDIASIDGSIEFLIPPREYLGSLVKNAQSEKILEWVENLSEFDTMILSLDTIAYGGLIPSRRSNDTLEDISARLKKLKRLVRNKNIYAFSSIMRISNNNYNEEEKEYWKDYGKKIFHYSYSGENLGIPNEILKDYLSTRKRNFEINKSYLNWNLNTLIYSKDDCAIKGFNVDEARELEKLGGKTKTGADEIPLTLFARAVTKDIKVYIEFTEPDYKECVSNYEDVSIEKSVLGQLELGGFSVVNNSEEADIILVVNNFIEKQGELVMDWDTKPFSKKFIAPNKPYAVADVRFANGADNFFVEQLLAQINMNNFYGYSGWNTSANSLGSLLSAIKVRWNAKQYNEYAFKRLQIIRLLDDWAYQANVRGKIEKPTGIKELMKPYEKILQKVFDYLPSQEITYTYPWNRKFEVEVNL